MKKFYYAIRGVKNALRDSSILIQFLLGIVAVICGILFHLSYTEWLVGILCIGLVIVSETINSCIEKLCDLYSEKYDPKIEYIKDLGAGFVFFSACTALIVALVILFHHL